MSDDLQDILYLQCKNVLPISKMAVDEYSQSGISISIGAGSTPEHKQICWTGVLQDQEWEPLTYAISHLGQMELNIK